MASGHVNRTKRPNTWLHFINIGTAKSLGLTIPDGLLTLADEAIE